jgi:hypothetical protein
MEVALGGHAGADQLLEGDRLAAPPAVGLGAGHHLGEEVKHLAKAAEGTDRALPGGGEVLERPPGIGLEAVPGVDQLLLQIGGVRFRFRISWQVICRISCGWLGCLLPPGAGADGRGAACFFFSVWLLFLFYMCTRRGVNIGP